MSVQVENPASASVRGRWPLLALVVLALVLVGLLLVWLNLRGEQGVHAYGHGGWSGSTETQAALVERGAYLARVGNCAGCHTAAGGAEYAGGRGLPTAFGTLYTSNLTSDKETGLGLWSAQDFWRALHNGRSREGRLLYPAFPYDSYTRVTRADSDALFAYLQSLPAVRAQTPPHALDFPYGWQGSLAVWRALFFSPKDWQDQPGKAPAWNRGAYLAQGLGHCAACHAPRNGLGASGQAMSGGFVAGQSWYAPSLLDPGEAGVRDGVRPFRLGTGPHGRSRGAQHPALAATGSAGAGFLSAGAGCCCPSCRHRRARRHQGCAAWADGLGAGRVRTAVRGLPWCAWPGNTGRVSCAGRQCFRDHGRAAQPAAGAAGRWLSPVHAATAAAAWHAALWPCAV
jgi:mono/diheme cytochrome c family protein